MGIDKSTGTAPSWAGHFTGDGYFSGNVAIGTCDATNVLTVAIGSATDPIADAWTTYSSRRFKTGVETLDGALAKIRQLRGVSFQWRADGSEDIGLIAEEVGEVVPEIVTYEANGVDARGLDYSRLVPLLVEAIKEQQAEIEALKARLEPR
ncbi:MAG: tail fiber domain-containing protein [bacterium]|nr:tail fiber domain-containing protein [bacterium]